MYFSIIFLIIAFKIFNPLILVLALDAADISPVLQAYDHVEGFFYIFPDDGAADHVLSVIVEAHLHPGVKRSVLLRKS